MAIYISQKIKIVVPIASVYELRLAMGMGMGGPAADERMRVYKFMFTREEESEAARIIGAGGIVGLTDDAVREFVATACGSEWNYFSVFVADEQTAKLTISRSWGGSAGGERGAVLFALVRFFNLPFNFSAEKLEEMMVRLNSFRLYGQFHGLNLEYMDKLIKFVRNSAAIGGEHDAF